MKVLFLDFDGVLNSHRWMATQPRGTNFCRALDQAAVGRLAEIVRRTDCKIVVSSTWRLVYGLADLRGILIDAGYPHPCPIIGATPNGCVVPARWIDRPASEWARGVEIQAWLDASPRRVESFAILDDSADMAHFLPRLIQTTMERGLMAEHVERAVAMLNGEMPEVRFDVPPYKD